MPDKMRDLLLITALHSYALSVVIGYLFFADQLILIIPIGLLAIGAIALILAPKYGRQMLFYLGVAGTALVGGVTLMLFIGVTYV